MSKFTALLISTALMVLSFPVAVYSPNLVPGPISSLTIWFAFVPMALALRHASPGESFRWGYFFGFTSNLGVFYWIIIAMHKYGNLSYLASGSILFSLVAELALYPAIMFWMMARLRKRAPAWLVGTTMFVLVEWTRVYFPLEGFSWGTPAYALYSATTLLQASDVIGTTGFNFLILLGNLSIAESLARRKEKQPFPRAAVVSFLVFFMACWLYGYLRIPQITAEIDRTPTLRVALLQGNISQDKKRSSGHRSSVLATYQELSLAAEQLNPQLMVWPEAALPMSVAIQTQRFPFLLPPGTKAQHLVGAPTWDRREGKRIYRNSAFTLNAQGAVQIRYDKQHLVPYGEYVPFADVLPMEKLVPAVAGNFSAGTGPMLSTLNQLRYGVLICYESLFPDISLDMVREGANFLVNITNDAWFDQTSGPYQHVRFGRFRSMETRRPMVRAANTGITTWFDPLGNLHDTLPMFSKGFLIADIHPGSMMTFYVRNPQLVPLITAMLLLLAALGFFPPARRNLKE